jgi:hypothetical protein
VKTHPACELDAKMAKSAQALHGHKVSCDRPTMPQTIERRDTCAHKGGRFRGRKSIGNRRHGFLSCDHILSISAIFLESGHLEVPTSHEIATSTRIAVTIMSTVPANSHSLAFLPHRHASAKLVYYSGYFVAGDPRVLQPRPMTFLHEDIAMADPTSLHSDTDLVALRCGDISLHYFKRCTR